MNKKKLAALLALPLLAAGAAGLDHMAHGISAFASVTFNNADRIHTEEEIRETVSMARHEFREFEGCVMTDIRYDDAFQEDTSYYQKIYGADVDDVLILKSTFTTSKTFSAPEFNGCTQDCWGWTFIHTAAGGWKFAGCGYA